MDAALARGVAATGADIADRARGRFPVTDYFSHQRHEPSIVTNPPFRLAVLIVQHALAHTAHGGMVAVVAQAKFLFSQSRHSIFVRPEMERVIAFSRRPSMPPGVMLAEQGEACRGGGSIDFLWAIWRVGKATPGCAMEWTL